MDIKSAVSFIAPLQSTRNPAPIPLRGDCPKGEPRPVGGSLRRVDRKNKKSAAICSDPAH